ncbi:50S ribosomal protein L23 [Candidatus Beckwithbacteria bacterium]|nr:50S ribosomal protein L23 [Candidatus Beckwithbacteria bacterium]
MRQDLVLKRPIITERSMTLAGQGRFTFEVHPKASKTMIAQAIEAAFKVSVVDVATSSIRGKIRRFGSRRKEAHVGAGKKAMVTLKKGQKIDLFEIREEK